MPARLAFAGVMIKAPTPKKQMAILPEVAGRRSYFSKRRNKEAGTSLRSSGMNCRNGRNALPELRGNYRSLYGVERFAPLVPAY